MTSVLRSIWLRIGLGACLVSPLVSGAEIEAGASWTQPWFTRLDVTFPDGVYHARWDFQRCACGDVLVQSEETLPEGVSTGEQLLLGGRVLLQRGFAEAGPAHLDSPMLMLQLLLVLLQKAGPAGPALVDAPYLVTDSEEGEALLLDTGTAHGGFPPPWSVVGEVRRVEDGSHRFGLEFRFDKNNRGGSELQLSGMLDYRSREFPLDEATEIEGWSVFYLQETDTEAFSGQDLKTLGELRAAIRNARLGD